MSALVTDQFRIFNAGNFVDSVSNESNSYYVFLGLSNPTAVGFGRTSTWNNTNGSPDPKDNLQYLSHYRDTGLFGRRITADNVRRVVRKVEWKTNTTYEMYRHDYSADNTAPITKSLRLYESNYYVINSDFRVYVCIDNGSTGTNPNGNKSTAQPSSIDSAPFAPGSDGYVWKYLFTVAPTDIIKFDSTEYIVLPNNWSTSTDPEISRIRDDADSEVNENQIKKVYIQSGGTSGYSDGVYDILGDGSGATVQITTVNGVITDVDVVNGGKGYTWGVVDLRRTGSIAQPGAKLIPIIPPSRGHGYDIYKELGADRVLIYARFDDSTRDFPTDTKFSQVGLLRNPTEYSGNANYTGSNYSSLYSIKLEDSYADFPNVGDEITQDISATEIARGWVASYDSTTKVLKYYRDRSLYFSNGYDQNDANNVSVKSKIVDFNNTASIEFSGGATSAQVAAGFSGSSSNGVNLGVSFSGGLANPEINKKTGDVIYIDNRPTVERNIRQKEDIKIILEF